MPDKPYKQVENIFWYAIAAATLLWLVLLGRHWWWRGILLAALALATFMVGCITAFLFTSYGEESAGVGKIKDWLIGALAGLTIIKAASIKPLLLLFAASPNNSEFALTISVATLYAGLGFFFMFFKRELIFNVVLAEKRAERGRIEGTRQAGAVTLQLLAAIPSSVLAGIEDAEDLLKNRKEEASTLRAELYSDPVNRFLEQSAAALASGLPLDWDVISKNAYLQYYRAYFIDKEDKTAQQQLALEWIIRALLINPEHMDLSIKRADILVLLKRFREAVLLLERINETPECPLFIDQWLGFYLLYLPGREDDSIAHSRVYLTRFPTSNESLRNIACAFAQKACRDSEAAGRLDLTSSNYKSAMANLAFALKANPDHKKVMQTTWIEAGGSFECFNQDPSFRAAVGLDATADVPATPKLGADNASDATP